MRPRLTSIAPECLSPQSGADDKQKRGVGGCALHPWQEVGVKC